MLDLTPYLRAACPVAAVETVEEERLALGLLALHDDWTWYEYDAMGLLYRLQATPNGLRREPTRPDTLPFTRLFRDAAELPPKSAVIVHDWHTRTRMAPEWRALKSALPQLAQRGNLIVLVAPVWQLPPELEHDIPVLEAPLPSRDDLREILAYVERNIGEEATPAVRRKILDAAAGLTSREAEDAIYRAVCTGDGKKLGRHVAEIVEREKIRLIRNTGYLEFWPPQPPNALGGLDQWRAYVQEEIIPAQHDPDLFVRAVLLVGVTGTGKSLSAKVLSGMLDWPLIRMDIPRLKGSLVGQSESNTHHALQLADSVAPCVLWWDEIEKGIAGHTTTRETDSGVSSAIMSILLTWMQEHTSQVMVVATSNYYEKLPAEFAARFDETFFLDLPTESERRDIAQIHLARYGCPKKHLDDYAEVVVERSHDWTGREIEQAIRSCARRTRRKFGVPELLRACTYVRPIARIRDREIAEMRAEADRRFQRANRREEEPETRKRRGMK